MGIALRFPSNNLSNISNRFYVRASETDFNNMTRSGYFFGKFVQNTPDGTTDSNWIIEVQAFDNNTGWTFQRATRSSDKAIFTRIQDNGTWSDWEVLALKSETLIFRGVFAGNLNDAASWKIPAGIYQINGEDTISNGPDGAQWCLFIQFPDSYHNQVMCLGGSNGVVTRRYIGSPQAWTSWT